MKRSLALLAAFVIASVHQTLLGETLGDWTYSLSDNQATITGYSGAGVEVVIPAVLNEMAVVKVGDGFQNDRGSYPPFFGNTVTSVTIPDSVTSIGDEAFYGCTSLTNVTLPKLLVEDVRIGAPMMRKSSEGKLLFNFQIQASDDLQNWTTLDTPEYEVIPSSDKEFLRVRVSNE